VRTARTVASSPGTDEECRMTHTTRTRARLGCESLEARENPSGNVAVSFGEVLQLRGDAADNDVRITQSNGVITVEGLNGTTVNGRAVLRSSALPEKVDVKLSGGNDRLITNGLRAAVDMNIEMDQGHDRVILRNTSAGVNLSVKMGNGQDTVTADGVRTGGDFFIDTEAGPSVVNVANTTVGKSLTVIGGLVADDVTISNTTTREDLNVEVKEGNDVVRLTDVRSDKNIKVDAGVGNDTVAVTRVSAASDAVFLGEDGFDTFVNRGVSGGEKLEIKGFERFV
jgi:hypothetical protein